MKSLDDRHSEVPGNYYETSVKTNLFQRFWHHRRFEEVGSLISTLSPTRVLDVGSHGGTFTSYMHSLLPRAKFTAIDLSADAIYYGEKKYPFIQFITARAEKIPFTSGSFDLVTCLEVLEHVEHPQLVIGQIKRVLKKDGDVVLLVPTENILFVCIWFLWTKLGNGRVWHHTHVQKFRGYSLDHLLERNGFTVVRRQTFLLNMLLLIHAKKSN